MTSLRTARRFFLNAWLALFFITVAASSQAASGPGTNLPNIVIIFADDLGYADIAKYGAQGIRTPNLDRLASEGRIFRNFHVAQAVCSASRAALLTGCYPNRIGIHGALGPRSQIGLSAGEMTLPELVKQRGYTTAAYGKWHLGDSPEFLPPAHGFDDYLGLPYSNDMWPLHPDQVRSGRKIYPDLPLFRGNNVINPSVSSKDQEQLTTRYTEEAVKFIEKNRNQPFFLYLAHTMPHVPLHVSDRFRGKSSRGLFGDVIEEIDWSVGQVMAALDQQKLKDNTWVIFTSDNGPWLSYGDHAGSALPLREGKGTSWEGGIRVPCIMRWPGKIPSGTESSSMLMTIDLLPTIAGRISGTLPQHPIDGMDVWPVIASEQGARNPHSSYWIYYERGQLQAVISGDGEWKLVLPHRYRTLGGRPGGRDGKPVAYSHIDVQKPMLYHLSQDISEEQDVAAKHPEIVQKLEAEAERARLELGDALKEKAGRGVRAPGRMASKPAGLKQ
jgi:arylsulfatase